MNIYTKGGERKLPNDVDKTEVLSLMAEIPLKGNGNPKRRRISPCFCAIIFRFGTYISPTQEFGDGQLFQCTDSSLGAHSCHCGCVLISKLWCLNGGYRYGPPCSMNKVLLLIQYVGLASSKTTSLRSSRASS